MESRKGNKTKAKKLKLKMKNYPKKRKKIIKMDKNFFFIFLIY